jgi:sterol desaturase/sphingolipid hydroxylase (fatty acid hydroxylase superfamily)
MNEIFSYFATIPSEHKLIWLVLCLSTATLAEFLIPLRQSAYSKLVHFRTNGALLVSTMIINSLFAALILIVCSITTQNQFGLLAIVDLPLWVECLIALAILDLWAQYIVHYLLHKVPILWRFHKVHHSDIHVDATTGTRHHPVDYFIREVFSVICVILLGMPPEYYAIYRIFTAFFTYFTHANIQLPHRMDKAISYVFVTPNAHKFHHHHEMPWTDTNFGNMFVFWDRLFGTFVYQSTKDIHYGVDTMDDNQAGSLKYQLMIPFNATTGDSVSSTGRVNR